MCCVVANICRMTNEIFVVLLWIAWLVNFRMMKFMPHFQLIADITAAFKQSTRR